MNSPGGIEYIKGLSYQSHYGVISFPLKGPLKDKFDINEKCSMCDLKTYFIGKGPSQCLL